VIVELGHGADRGTRRAHLIRLVYGDCRRDTVYGVDLWFVHAVKELPRIRRECLDIAALPLGVERIEYQRRFPGTRHPGYHDQFVERQLNRKILQIVLACALNKDAIGGQRFTKIHGRELWALGHDNRVDCNACPQRR
jgi:hypothetical protein